MYLVHVSDQGVAAGKRGFTELAQGTAFVFKMKSVHMAITVVLSIKRLCADRTVK
jgi:hypothetical protein